MFYAIKSFLSEVTVVLLDEDKQPFTFYTIRAEDINLGDLYVAQITEKMQEQKAFCATIGDGRDVYLASKQPLEIGQRITVVITNAINVIHFLCFKFFSIFEHPFPYKY